MAPPSTFEIYMQSNASMMTTNPFGLQPDAKVAHTSAMNSTGFTSQQSPASYARRNLSNNNLNWRKPLEEFGLREAYESSMYSGQTSMPRTAPGGKRRAKAGGV